MSYQAIKGAVVIRDEQEPARRDSGLYIPDAARRELTGIGTVLSVGGRATKKGAPLPVAVKVGQRVVYRKYEAWLFDDAEEEGYVCSVPHDAVLSVLESPAKAGEITMTGFRVKGVDLRQSDFALRNREKMIVERNERQRKLQQGAAFA
jgi:co-chaperonin GroES (HSP10)